MKFTLQQLHDHLDTKASTAEIAERLTAIGHEVEEMIDKSAIYAPFTIAEIRSCEKHPNADRLKVCKVWNGREELQIVCGAPNAREGIKVVLSRPGDYIPGLGITLKASKIRDVESQGMLCSDDELQLAAERSGGIMELKDDAKVGDRFADYAGLNDVLFDVALTPNRGDAASVYGLARDLAASGMGRLNQPKVAAIKGMFDSPIKVAVEADSGCRHYAGRFLRGVKNGPSPDWLQKYLRDVGLRPISALVDITNYTTHAFGRPLHVYDAAKLTGTVRAAPATKTEEMEALDGKIYTLQPGMGVIADDAGTLGVGGVIGGAPSGCTLATADVFIECAWFEPHEVARTGRALECISDARYRFERGVDPEFVRPGMEMATSLIMKLCGGTPSHVVEAGEPVKQSRVVPYDPAMAQKLGGASIPPAQQKEFLTALGAKVEEKKPWQVTMPSWRPDWEDAADTVEEIVRLNGYSQIPVAYLPPFDPAHPYKNVPIFTRGQDLTFQAGRTLAAQGYQESVTWSFLSEKTASLWGDIDPAMRLTNPISADLAIMRPSLLPNLLAAAARNGARGQDIGALFEIGPVFHGTEPDRQPVMIGGLRFGPSGHRHWRDKSREADAFDVKRDVVDLLNAIGFPTGNLRLQDIPAAPAIYHPGQSGQFALGKNRIARFGALHPALLDEADLKGSASGFEIDWQNVLQLLTAKKTANAKPLLQLPELQKVTRDFAFLLDKNVQASSLMSAIQEADKTLIDSVRVFDVYMGKNVPEGQKSLAVEVTLQPRDKTLTEEDLNKLSAAVIASAAKLGASIRS